jgi:hypothetical protein
MTSLSVTDNMSEAETETETMTGHEVHDGSGCSDGFRKDITVSRRLTAVMIGMWESTRVWGIPKDVQWTFDMVFVAPGGEVVDCCSNVGRADDLRRTFNGREVVAVQSYEVSIVQTLMLLGTLTILARLGFTAETAVDSLLDVVERSGVHVHTPVHLCLMMVRTACLVSGMPALPEPEDRDFPHRLFLMCPTMLERAWSSTFAFAVCAALHKTPVL